MAGPIVHATHLVHQGETTSHADIELIESCLFLQRVTQQSWNWALDHRCPPVSDIAKTRQVNNENRCQAHRPNLA